MKSKTNFFLTLMAILGILTTINATNNITKKGENEIAKTIKNSNNIQKVVNTVPNNTNQISEEQKSQIKIQNLQNDEIENTYTYKIVIQDVVGAKKYSINDKISYTVFNAKGEAYLNLKSNETLIIFDIPLNKTYKIEQNINNNYLIYINNQATNKYIGTISSNNDIIFNNTSNIVNANPETVDNIYIYLINIFVLGLILIIIKKAKIKRYE